MEQEEEKIEAFDESGNPLGVRSRAEVHTKPLQYWHKVVNIWLVDTDARILCTKRAETVGGNPGKWQTFAGGHVQAGQSPLQAATAELKEELGLTATAADLYPVESGRWEPSKHLVEAFAYRYDGAEPLHFNDGEITDAKWMTFAEYKADRKANPDLWCNGISSENQEKIRQLTAIHV